MDGSNQDTHLVNDAQTLTEFLNSAKIPVVAVTILADRDVKLDLRRGLSNRARVQCHQHTSSYLSYGCIFLRSQGIPLPRNMTPVKL